MDEIKELREEIAKLRERIAVLEDRPYLNQLRQPAWLTSPNNMPTQQGADRSRSTTSRPVQLRLGNGLLSTR